ncbi:hypothetical protein OAJ78_02225 [Gammaproteobacteria bacterium]|nr:hypothetical protein [Gammaproteobacteria bacterium]
MGTHTLCVERSYFTTTMEMKDMETMEELIRANETKTTSYEITDEILEKYCDPNFRLSPKEPDEGRPVLIDPGFIQRRWWIGVRGVIRCT